jgi:hypothetical protein
VTVSAGNVVGTGGKPTQAPPNSAAAGSEVESVRRPGVAKRRPDADDDNDVVGDVVGGIVGGRLKVTCCGRPCSVDGGAWSGGACVTGRPLRSGLAGSVSASVRAALRRSVDTLSVLLPVSMRKKCVDRSSTQ